MGKGLRLSAVQPGRARRVGRRRSARSRGEPEGSEHPVETLQRTIGNRATTLLIQRDDKASSTVGGVTDPAVLPPDATMDQLHAEYQRGRSMFDAGLFDEAVAVWTPVYAHPTTRGNTRLRGSLAIMIGRANQHAGHATEAVSWYEEAIATPGADPSDLAAARRFIVQSRRNSEVEQGGKPGPPLPPDATDDQLHAQFLEGLAQFKAGLFDDAVATLVPVYEHPKLGPDKRDDLALDIALAHFHAHHFDSAISWFQEAMETEGADPGTVALAHQHIAECRRGSEEAAGTTIGPQLDPDATQDDLHAQYVEGKGLFAAGLFAEAIAAWVPVYEHPKVGDEKRGPLAISIGSAHHHLFQFAQAVHWYVEALARGLEDVDAVVTERRLAQARDGKPLVKFDPEKRHTVLQGSTGRDVRFLQERLKSFGYELKVDAIFGPETDGKVREFQTNNGLQVDGIVGPRTWSVLS